MKCQLIGYQSSSGVDKETNKEYKSITLFFIRKPSLSENGVVGNVCFSCRVYDEACDKLPELHVDGAYNVDANLYKGKYYLQDLSSLK